jgi:hypothetical protein
MTEADELIQRIRNMPPPPKGPDIDGQRGSGDDDGMEERLKILEHAVAVIEAKLPDLATNDGVDARLSKTETKIIVWVVGAVIATGLAGKFIFPANTPAVAPAPAPIIIQVPATPQAAAPAIGSPTAKSTK